MKHADASALLQLEGLLSELRKIPGLVERKPGIFYRRSKAFLHFHQDRTDLFADVKFDGSSFERFCVSSTEESNRFARAVRIALEVEV